MTIVITIEVITAIAKEEYIVEVLENLLTIEDIETVIAIRIVTSESGLDK
ncbi:hypothetical protein H1P_480002 [Hyella patelloides LEGE 07179]|uniref:Uncharacterized protein n=1 Tax=Hyella patelloides LEGE 07179 TaxID=945734 RepID=A0A563VYY4_9CYAN|nr:hypothetical protein H1P_480002 [Hyella patelloides LEGE 07179]